MDIFLIAAISDNNVIGKNGKTPWEIPADMKRFKRLTLNHPVIMGRKTYESIPLRFRPLMDRKNIVLSKNLESREGIYVARNLEEALDLTNGKDSYIIGGESIYELFLPKANKMELTIVHKKYDGDAFFPKVKWLDWDLIDDDNILEKDISYSFLTYEKRKINER